MFVMRGIICSALIAAAGILLLLFNAGVLPMHYKSIIFSWQMLLFAVGFVMLFRRYSKIPSLICMGLGLIFLSAKFNVVELDFIKKNALAIALLLIGIISMLHLIFGHRRCRMRYHQMHYHHWHRMLRHRGFAANDGGSDTIDWNCVFFSGKHKFNYSTFKGGEVNCVFGELEMDFAGAHMASGVNTLEVNTIFGNTILRIPEQWRVKIQQTTAFGSFTDKRCNPPADNDALPLLVISGSTVFGCGEVINAAAGE
jgi:predicted membrane protein